MAGIQTIGQCVPFWVDLSTHTQPTILHKKMMMKPIPSPQTLKILRNKKRTRNTHQNEETEPNAKNKNNSDSFYLQCQHEYAFKELVPWHFGQTIL